jgi:hypothetical protein
MIPRPLPVLRTTARFTQEWPGWWAPTTLTLGARWSSGRASGRPSISNMSAGAKRLMGK